MLYLLALLAGCTDEPETQEATWLQGAYYRWVIFNHRLSYAHVSLNDNSEAELMVVGGTSTSQRSAELPDTCDQSTCNEIPARDFTDLRVGWGRLITDTEALGTGRAELVVGEDGGSTTLEVALPDWAEGDVTAVIRGIVLDTDQPLQGEAACYNPQYGWHVRQIRAVVEDVTLSGTTATVTVGATFAAGLTEEEIRACIDEVYDRAQVALSVDVMVVAGHGGVTEQTVTSEAYYPFESGQAPPAQEEVLPEPLSDLSGDGVVGWSAIDFRFNPELTNERGAYLRSWGFEITEDGAAGIATNFSPGTQQHDMAYSFTGTVREVVVSGAVETGLLDLERFEVDVDGEDRPVVQTVPLE